MKEGRERGKDARGGGGSRKSLDREMIKYDKVD